MLIMHSDVVERKRASIILPVREIYDNKIFSDWMNYCVHCNECLFDYMSPYLKGVRC